MMVNFLKMKHSNPPKLFAVFEIFVDSDVQLVGIYPTNSNNMEVSSRWAPTCYQWTYYPYKWPYKCLQ